MTAPRLVLATILCVLPVVFEASPSAPPPTPAATLSFAKQYLKTVERTQSFPSADGRRTDYVFVGATSEPRSVGWRVVAVRGDSSPRLVWDSAVFRKVDDYLQDLGLDGISIGAGPDGGYLITLVGCVPRQCGGTRIGVALFSSKMRRTYSAHVTDLAAYYPPKKSPDGRTHDVDYLPPTGIPDLYRQELNRLVCSAFGRVYPPPRLPISCGAR